MFDSKIYIKCTRTAQGGGASLRPRSASVELVRITSCDLRPRSAPARGLFISLLSVSKRPWANPWPFFVCGTPRPNNGGDTDAAEGTDSL